MVSELLFYGVMVPSLEWLYDTHPELVHLMPDRFMDEDQGFAILDVGPNGMENPW